MYKIAFTYQWATFGGIERILLNRIEALQKEEENICIDVIFERDLGALLTLQETVANFPNINFFVAQNLKVLTTGKYDLIFCIDHPSAIQYCETHSLPYAIECHTGYKKNRQYLTNLSINQCKAIVVPSSSFFATVKNEIKHLSTPLVLLNNFVLARDALSSQIGKPQWDKYLIIFFGRLDHLKNVSELLRAFELLPDQIQQNCYLLLAGPRSIEIDLQQEMTNKKLFDKTILLPAIPFKNTSSFIALLRNYQSIFVSPSSNESFGLSAAEMMQGGIPVILSDIPAHRDLVKGEESIYTYPLGNAKDLSDKIIYFIEHYDSVQKPLATLSEKFSSQNFIEEWRALLRTIDIVNASSF